jgi:hypothetical protein
MPNIDPFNFEFLSDIEKKKYVAQNLAGFGNKKRIKAKSENNESFPDYALRIFPSD